MTIPWLLFLFKNIETWKTLRICTIICSNALSALLLLQTRTSTQASRFHQSVSGNFVKGEATEITWHRHRRKRFITSVQREVVLGFVWIYLQSRSQKANVTCLSSFTESDLLQHYPERDILCIFSWHLWLSVAEIHTNMYLDWCECIYVCLHITCVCDTRMWGFFCQETIRNRNNLSISLNSIASHSKGISKYAGSGITSLNIGQDLNVRNVKDASRNGMSKLNTLLTNYKEEMAAAATWLLGNASRFPDQALLQPETPSNLEEKFRAGVPAPSLPRRRARFLTSQTQAAFAKPCAAEGRSVLRQGRSRRLQLPTQARKVGVPQKYFPQTHRIVSYLTVPPGGSLLPPVTARSQPRSR